jgi:hypothetical protein
VFLATNDGVSSWVAGQPGFMSRELAYDAGGERWVDVIWWTSLEHAKAAAAAAMSSPSCAPMFSLIDQASTLMLHAELTIAVAGG